MAIPFFSQFCMSFCTSIPLHFHKGAYGIVFTGGDMKVTIHTHQTKERFSIGNLTISLSKYLHAFRVVCNYIRHVMRRDIWIFIYYVNQSITVS